MGGFGIAILFSLFSFVYLFFVAIAISVILYLLYSYIFQSIASMCMLKNIGYAYPFTAWIPFYHKYLLGKIANKQILGAILVKLPFIPVPDAQFSHINSSLFCFLFSTFFKIQICNNYQLHFENAIFYTIFRHLLKERKDKMNKEQYIEKIIELLKKMWKEK